jgi:DNA (cytosine-5)-methyltransferase 1
MYKGQAEQYIAAMSRESRETPSNEKQTSKIVGPKVVGLFAGVGGLEAGFRKAGFHSVMLCEVDPNARKVLEKRFPGTMITQDIRTLEVLPLCDVVTAGFPCQDLSQVGPRKGIRGPNSGLVEHVFELLEKAIKPPTWLVLENVPFMLKLDKGKAIAKITRSLEEMGWSWAYRTIDTRAFGLPQRRRRVMLVASKTKDPRPVLFGSNYKEPEASRRTDHACGFYWTEGNTGLGWAVDAIPPLKGGSALHIPSPPAIWFPGSKRIVVPSIEDAERLQGFPAGWTASAAENEGARRCRWRLIGNAVSVPVAEWIGRRLLNAKTAHHTRYDREFQKGPWPDAAWGKDKVRKSVEISEWPAKKQCEHLASFLAFPLRPLSVKATKGFHGRLVDSSLRYEEAFERDLRHHMKKHEKKSKKRSGKRKH